jgi:hypothetical protein
MIIKIDNEYINLDHVANFYSYETVKIKDDGTLSFKYYVRFHLPNNINKTFLFQDADHMQIEMMNLETAIFDGARYHVMEIKSDENL